MADVTPKAQFLSSLNRCLAAEDFIPRFYQRFLATSDEIRQMFHATDFHKQHQMLARSLYLSAAATEGDPEGLREIAERARTHSRSQLNVRPELYDFWLSAIIETAEEFDPDWSEATDEAWRRILGYVVQHMIRHY